MMMTIDIIMRPIPQIASINNDALSEVSTRSRFADVIVRYNRTVVTQRDRRRFLKFSELKFEDVETR